VRLTKFCVLSMFKVFFIISSCWWCSSDLMCWRIFLGFF